MTTLIITRGLPGSGKSTRAHAWVAEDPEARARVNRDDLRGNLFNQFAGLTYAQEQTVTVAQHAAVRALLTGGKDVIVDDTNLRLRNARKWADIAVETGSTFEVWDILTPADECVARDAARDRVVGEDAIRHLNRRFSNRDEVLPTVRQADAPPAPYVAPGLSAPYCWLVDVDGTLALMGDRSPYDITTVSSDAPNHSIVELAGMLSLNASLVIMSGRSEECRADTEAWLDKHLGEGNWTCLHMRATGDQRPDFKVKADLFDAHVREKWNVLGVLDDRTRVVKMWRSIGLTCLQVADGDF